MKQNKRKSSNSTNRSSQTFQRLLQWVRANQLGKKLSVFSKGMCEKAERIAPKFSSKAKEIFARYPDASAVIITAGGIVAVITGKKMVVVGTTVILGASAAAAAALAVGQPEFALLFAAGAVLGLKTVIVGAALVVAGWICIPLGPIWLTVRLIKWLRGRLAKPGAKVKRKGIKGDLPPTGIPVPIG